MVLGLLGQKLAKNSINISLLICALFLTAINAYAAIDQPARTEVDIRNGKDSVGTLEMKKVRSTKVVVADYGLISRDFPAQARRAGEDIVAWHFRVDDWLVRETGFISIKQLNQTVVNTEIPTSETFKVALSPESYNRAAVIPVENGLIDVKGSGHRIGPRQAGHGNGLATLGEMIREYIYEKQVSNVFEAAGTGMRTVGCYAVLDYGFDVTNADGSKDRAGAVLRQAHARATGPNSTLPKETGIKVEETLRKFGLTGSGETYALRQGPQAGQYQFDYVNIQGTNNPGRAEVIDFGAFLAVDKFDYNLTNGQGTIYSAKSDPNFVQPDLQKRVSLEQWGDFGVHDPKRDKPWQWSHELAKAIAEGRADRAAVDQHVANMVGPFKKKFNPTPAGCELLYRALPQQ